MDKKLEETPWNGLIIYPEGERNSTPKSGPLRTGALRYIFDRQIETQIMISYGKELSFSEKNFKAAYGRTVHTSYSKVIYPKDFKTIEEFNAEIQRLWDKQWKLIFAREYPEYPETSKLQQQKKEGEEGENNNNPSGGDDEEEEKVEIVDYEPPYIAKAKGRSGKYPTRFRYFAAASYATLFLLWYFFF